MHAVIRNGIECVFVRAVAVPLTMVREAERVYPGGKWLDESEPHNIPIIHALDLRRRREHKRTGVWPNILDDEMAMGHYYVAIPLEIAPVPGLPAVPLFDKPLFIRVPKIHTTGGKTTVMFTVPKEDFKIRLFS